MVIRLGTSWPALFATAYVRFLNGAGTAESESLPRDAQPDEEELGGR